MSIQSVQSPQVSNVPLAATLLSQTSYNLDTGQPRPTDVLGNHCLNVLHPSTDSAYQVQHVCPGSFNLVALRWQGALQIEYQQPDRLYGMYVVLAGKLEQQFNQGQTVCCPLHPVAMAIPGQGLIRCTSEQGQALFIGIDRSLIEQTISNLLKRPLSQPVVFALPSNLTDELSRTLKQLGQCLWYLGMDLAPASAVVAQLEQAFLTYLVQGLPHNYSEDLLYQQGGKGLSCHVQKARAFIEANLQADIQLKDISAAVGVCPRTLEKAFACYCDCSPMQFLRQMRLHRVRADLCDALPGTKVIDVMMRYGFTQGGKFARAYRELFGELPSETLKRHRLV